MLANEKINEVGSAVLEETGPVQSKKEEIGEKAEEKEPATLNDCRQRLGSEFTTDGDWEKGRAEFTDRVVQYLKKEADYFADLALTTWVQAEAEDDKFIKMGADRWDEIHTKLLGIIKQVEQGFESPTDVGSLKRELSFLRDLPNPK